MKADSMKTDSMKADTSTQNGGGMSRAAKKRAKKSKKTSEQRQVEKAVDDDQEPEKNKKMKLEDEKNLMVDPPSKESSDKEDQNGKAKVDDEIEEGGDDNCVSDGEDEEPTPSFPDTPLTEILLLQESKDKQKAAVLQHLTAKQRAAAAFQAIIDPISLDEFYEEYWEKKPLLVRAKNNKNRYDGLLSLESIKKISKQHPLYYGRDVNVTKYQKDAHGVKRRIMLDKLPEDEKDQDTGILVNRSELWSNYDKGCTIRMLCPHKQEDNIHALLSTLELELKCMVGANAYLTPPNAAQGFAPHYDDIEAFCLQLQGSKRWKVYEPTIKLPRASSEDFTTEDLKEMEPVMDITLEQGDLLYMPRGWIHQACTLKHSDLHSLHLTVSAMQQWAWCDLLDMIMPEALSAATMSETNTSLRQGLPRGFLDYMGAMHDSSVDPNLPESMQKAGNDDIDGERGEAQMEKAKTRRQEKFRLEAKKRIMKVALQACEMVDAACDQLGKRFLSDRQPPALTKKENDGTNNDDEKDPVEKEILPSTLCRLARPGIARLVLEDEKAVVYHCADNARVFHGHALSPLEFDMDDGPALEQLITTVEPEWIMINDLLHDSIEDKVAIAGSLYDDGILQILNPDEADE